MGAKQKYKEEREIAENAVKNGSLPIKIDTDNPKSLANVLFKFFRRKNNYDVGFSTEEDGVWLHKR